jgi:hypothetical protein
MVPHPLGKGISSGGEGRQAVIGGRIKDLPQP